MSYNPGLGTPWSFEPSPRRRLGQDGWYDGLALRDLVFAKLSKTFGGVAPIGKGSFDAVTWHDRDSAGRRTRVTAGEWKTAFVRTPRAVLACVAESEVEPLDPKDFAERKLRARWWTERRSGLARPGRLELQLVLYSRARGSTDGQAVLVPPLIGCLASDLIAALENA